MIVQLSCNNFSGAALQAGADYLLMHAQDSDGSVSGELTRQAEELLRLREHYDRGGTFASQEDVTAHVLLRHLGQALRDGSVMGKTGSTVTVEFEDPCQAHLLLDLLIEVAA